MPLPPPPWTWFIRKMKRKTIRAKGSRVARIEPSRLGCGFSELDFSMVPLEICSSTASMMPSCWPSTQWAITLLPPSRLTPPSRVALMTWSPSMNEISCTWPAAMYWLIWDVEISSYPPLGVRYCRARSDADDGDDDPQPGTLEQSSSRNSLQHARRASSEGTTVQARRPRPFSQASNARAVQRTFPQATVGPSQIWPSSGRVVSCRRGGRGCRYRAGCGSARGSRGHSRRRTRWGCPSRRT